MPPPPTPAPSLDLPISTGDAAMAAVVAAEPRFAGILPRNLDLIGQSTWWEARPASGVGAFVVVISVGWGDCQAGCIDEHHWTYAVTPDGGARLLSEDGAPIPPDVLPGGEAGRTGVAGHATAGPVCPVETVPPDPNCAPRPVVGARIAALDPSGSVVAETTTDATGAFAIDLPAGDYTIQADPAAGLMGTPEAVPVTVAAGTTTTLDLAYDTGIR
jgi:Carboxypeptidase regulatory-like domain